MKATIITMMLAVGLLVRPQPLLTADAGAASIDGTSVINAQQPEATMLSTAEMSAAVGGDTGGCYQTKAANGDVYQTCCLDLWIFSICVGVNWSAVERFFGSLF